MKNGLEKSREVWRKRSAGVKLCAFPTLANALTGLFSLNNRTTTEEFPILIVKSETARDDVSLSPLLCC